MPLTTFDIPVSTATLFYNSERSLELSNLIQKLSGTNDTDWDFLELPCEDLQISLHRAKWKAGNLVSVTILKLLNFMKREFGPTVRQDSRVELLLTANFMIGLTFEPQLKKRRLSHVYC